MESAEVDEQTVLSLRLTMRAVRRTAGRKRNVAVDAVLHGRDHIGDTARPDHSPRNGMPIAAVVLG